jgi:UDP-glucose 4-epimerase
MYGMVIPRFVKQALSNSAITVFGDGSQSRVFCHVLDAVEGVSSLLPEESSIGEVFNIGGKGEISVLELASKIVEVLNSNSEIVFVDPNSIYPDGFEDMQRRVPDISKINNLTGWEPKRNLDQIIKDVAEQQKA